MDTDKNAVFYLSAGRYQFAISHLSQAYSLSKLETDMSIEKSQDKTYPLN